MTDEKPRTLTADEAIARMRTWIEEPGEEYVDAIVVAAKRWVESGRGCDAVALREAVTAHEAERVERVQTSSGSFGCASDADIEREALRASDMIVEVEGHTLGGVMLRARGCHIAYRDGDGRWCGVGSTPSEDRP